MSRSPHQPGRSGRSSPASHLDNERFASSPSGPGSVSNALNGVSCLAATSCKAVGWYVTPTSGNLTLIASWNGTAWSVAPSPNAPETTSDGLYGVSCVSAISCKAVGYAYGQTTTTAHTLLESWNGSNWSIVSSPNTQTGTDVLHDVSCVSPTSCKGVGYFTGTNRSDNFNLIESWNASTWSITPSPDQGSLNNGLLGVSCGTATSCKAVGYFTGASGTVRILIESSG